MKFKYCDKVLTRGIYKLKLNLARTSKDVGACIAILEDIKKLMWGVVYQLQNLISQNSNDLKGVIA